MTITHLISLSHPMYSLLVLSKLPWEVLRGVAAS